MLFRSQRIQDQDVAAVIRAAGASLTKLRPHHAYGILVHHAQDLMTEGGDRLWDALTDLRRRGSVEKIGVSVYHPEQLDAILDRYPVDLVQLPLNVYDQRFLQIGLLDRLKRAQVEVHTRSAFLQGLLLIAADRLPGYFEPLRERQAAFHARAHGMGLSPLAACLRFCLAQPAIDRVIVGCESAVQLAGIVEAAQAATSGDRPFEGGGLDRESTRLNSSH